MQTNRKSAEGPRLGAARAARRRAAYTAWLLALAVCACACEKLPPNLVIVTLDTTRADHLGLYGYFRDTSPALDAFGQNAIVFERAIVPMATTLPTHTSLFTATQPLEHGVLANSTQGGSRFVPTPRIRLLAEAARDAGWRTAAFVSAAPLRRGSGLETGFELFDEPSRSQRDGEATTTAVLAWLERVLDEPFLLWVHYFDAHWPYTPPAPYATLFTTDAELEASIAARHIPRSVYRPLVAETEQTRASINLYDGELRYQDAQLAKLLAALEARPDWGRTVVLIAGDHGEGLGQHGEAAHGGTWDEQLHAPLLLRVPGEASRRVAMPIAAVDVIPTLLGRLDAPGLEPLLAQASGHDVLADGVRPLAILSQDTGREREASEQRTSLTTQRWKLLRADLEGGGVRRMLFDLRADPFELTDVSSLHPDVTDQLSAALAATLDAQRRKGAALRGGAPPATTLPDPALLEQLRALGYIEDQSGR